MATGEEEVSIDTQEHFDDSGRAIAGPPKVAKKEAGKGKTSAAGSESSRPARQLLPLSGLASASQVFPPTQQLNSQQGIGATPGDGLGSFGLRETKVEPDAMSVWQCMQT